MQATGAPRRLGKQPRRVDSLDVESMNVRGAHGQLATAPRCVRSPGPGGRPWIETLRSVRKWDLLPVSIWCVRNLKECEL